MHTKRGFTLIELLVVILLIGLLTTIATASFLSAQRNARDDARKTGVNSIGNALEAYKLVNQSYPGQVNATADTSNCAGNTNTVSGTTYAAYYDAPVASTTGCTTISSASFQPAPNWIPNLGKYLNPPPIEPRYVDTNGGTTGAGTFDQNGQPTSYTRTYSYQKTATGYFVYTKLESGTAYSVSK